MKKKIIKKEYEYGFSFCNTKLTEVKKMPKLKSFAEINSRQNDV